MRNNAFSENEYEPQVIQSDCVDWLTALSPPQKIALTFLDPPFNQGKQYQSHDDRMDKDVYWNWMRKVCELTREHTTEGGAIYFMQREKNTEQVLCVLRESGWDFQNLILWKKLTSAVPSTIRFGKTYQIVVFATNGKKPAVFNRLRIDPPLPTGYKPRNHGVFVTDIWDDIRELTSGYFAGSEPLRDRNGDRIHKQQSPNALLLRIVLSSTLPGMLVFDPFAGTGTTAVVARQLKRHSLVIEKDASNHHLICERLDEWRDPDNISKFYPHYVHTANLAHLWGQDESRPNTRDVAESSSPRITASPT